MEKKVLILSSGPQNRLKEEFKKLDVEADVISPNDFYCYLSNVRGHDRLYLRSDDDEKGKNKRIKIKDYAAIVPRISGSGFDYGKLIVKHVSENLKIFSTASEFGLALCSNKFETSQFLSKHRIRVPKQVLAHGLSDYKEAINLVGGFPFVLKLQRGSQGAGVFLIRDETEASQTLRALKFSKLDVILSQKLDSGTPANDLRIWVIGAMEKEPEIIGYKRFALDEDFRSNYSLSHSGEKVELTDEEKEMALKAAQVLRMQVAGIDIMRDEPDNNKPYVIEVNGNPGLAGIEAVTEVNVAEKVADFVVKNYEKGNTWDNRYYEKIIEMMNVRFLTQKAFANIAERKSYAAMEYLKNVLNIANQNISEYANHKAH